MPAAGPLARPQARPCWLACLTRKTHAFAKAERTWDAAVGLAVFEHNWLRPHPALRQAPPHPAAPRRYDPRTPAMAIGLTGHIWGWEEFLSQPAPPPQGE